MKKVIALVSVLALSACSGWDVPGSAPQVNHNNPAVYDYVGCYKVKNNPDGAVRYFGPFGVDTPVAILKQRNADGTPGTVQATEKCF